jgi:phage terminase large subunit-like protein
MTRKRKVGARLDPFFAILDAKRNFQLYPNRMIVW